MSHIMWTMKHMACDHRNPLMHHLCSSTDTAHHNDTPRRRHTTQPRATASGRHHTRSRGAEGLAGLDSMCVHTPPPPHHATTIHGQGLGRGGALFEAAGGRGHQRKQQQGCTCRHTRTRAQVGMVARCVMRRTYSAHAGVVCALNAITCNDANDRRVHAISDNWEELRRGEASFQLVQPRNEPAAGPVPRRRAHSTMRRRLQRQMQLTAARAASARSARSGRPAPCVLDAAQRAVRARAAELLRQQRQGGGTSGASGGGPSASPASKRAREGSDEDDDVPLAQRAAQRAARQDAVAQTTPLSPGQPSRMQQLYNAMGVHGPVQDARDVRIAALARRPADKN